MLADIYRRGDRSCTYVCMYLCDRDGEAWFHVGRGIVTVDELAWLYEVH